ncbi:macro domain-containing protein [Myxococcota bacterium]|nr:macro domain-containing protein [Myxococcota bacterium]MBU1899226.1 macro domain-containing protein [Myxococcota bacterium]
MPIEHLELIVEEPSMEQALRGLLPKILGDALTWEIYTHQCKDELLERLPSRLRGYASWLDPSWRVIVLLDRDDNERRGAVVSGVDVGGAVPNYKVTIQNKAKVHLTTFEEPSLSAWIEALNEVLDPEDAHPFTIDLRPLPHQRGLPFSIPEAVEAIMERCEGCHEAREIELVVAHERIADAVHGCLKRGASVGVEFGGLEIIIRQGDIARAVADAIVNASNTLLRLGGGVSGAIRRACSRPEQLQAAMFAKGPISEGDAVLTDAFGLPGTSKIIHAATAKGDEAMVQRAWTRCLSIAEERGFTTLAVPALGTGSGGLSVDRCARAAVEAVEAHLERGEGALKRLIIVVYQSPTTARIFLDAFEGAQPRKVGRVPDMPLRS